MRVRIDRRPVAHLGHRDQILRTLPAEELTEVGAPAQALIAVAALRRARDAHAIADRDTPHLGADRFDNADAAVALDEYRVIPPRGAEAEHGADVGVTEVGRL